MTNQIVEKINKEFKNGLKSEAQVVYLLSGIRKIIEQEGNGEHFPYLKFHCHWTLHSKLSGPPAQKIFKEFLSSQLQLLMGERATIDPKIKNISSLNQFKSELKLFFVEYKFDFDIFEVFEWKYFQYLYYRVIEDVPLQLVGNAVSEIVEIKVNVEPRNSRQEVLEYFEVGWNLRFRDGSRKVLKSYNVSGPE